MSTKPVFVYGVSGYTGRLVCEHLRQFNVPFTAAGRSAARVKEVVERIPGIETADYDIVEVPDEVGALTAAISGSRVVNNTVGPFIQHGPPVVEAAYRAGAHYTDTTGEQNWTLACREEWGEKFAAKDLLIAPGVAQMYTTGEIAAHIALETVPGVDTLDILVLWGGLPTAASTQTIFTILQADWFYLEQNQLQPWDPTTTFQVVVPGQHELGLALPWGGTGHPIWFQRDPRVANVKVAAGVFNRAIMETVVGTVKMYVEQIKPLGPEAARAKLAEIAAGAQSTMPPRENRRLNNSLDSVYGSGPLGRVHVVIHGNSNYQQTGLLQAYASYHLTQSAPRVTGFASGCQAFGHHELLGTLKSFGLVLDPEITVND